MNRKRPNQQTFRLKIHFYHDLSEKSWLDAPYWNLKVLRKSFALTMSEYLFSVFLTIPTIETTDNGTWVHKTLNISTANREAPTSSELLTLGGQRFGTTEVGGWSPKIFLAQNLYGLRGCDHQNRSIAPHLSAISLGDFFWLYLYKSSDSYLKERVIYLARNGPLIFLKDSR